MRKFLRNLAAVMLLTFTGFLIGQAQTTTGSIAGTVIDSNGAIIPNATVTIRGRGGQEFTVQTADNGTFRIPAVGSGIYTVTVTAANFKTSVVENVKVDVGLPTTVGATLTAGDINETVVVTSGGEVLQTQTATIGTTITGRQITELPLTSRDALDLVTLLPGTNTVGRPRTSTINGLPKGSLSITIDGVDVQDNLLRSSDGFFTYVRPRIDAIEEVTVSTANPGAESSGDGAVQIKFITRRGTNDYTGGLYYQHRNTDLNANYFFNNRSGLPRTRILLNQYGGRFGGPIPFLNFGEGGPTFNSGKNRAFFFVNYEEFRIPESATRTRTILSPLAQSGVFQYIVGNETRSVNVLQLAGANNLPSTVDPIIGPLLTQIRNSTSSGTIRPINGAPNFQNFDFINPGGQKRYFTAVRLDFNLNKNNSLENVTNYQIFRNSVDFLNGVDPAFPGFPNFGGQDSDRLSNTTALRTTLTQNLVNEARFSFSGGMSFFRKNLSLDQFQNQGGYNLNLNGALGITNATAVTSNNRRVSPTFDFSDSVTYIAGAHNITFGGQYKLIKLRTASVNQIVPQISFGIDTTDTAANNVFNAAANFPGSSAAQRSQAAALYAVLTGRVTAFSGNVYLNESGTYEFLGDQLERAKQNTYGLFAQDSWRIKSNLTVNYGLRWQPQEAYTVSSANFARASNFTDVFGLSGEGNLFKPGTLSGVVPSFVGVEPGYKAFDTDFNNFAPSVGVVYSPNFSEGLMRGIFGATGKSVIRGGYSLSFVREGTNVLLSILGSNPGGSLSATRSISLGNLEPGTLLRNPVNLTPAPFPTTPVYPITGLGTTNPLVGSTAVSTNVFDPNLKTGNVHSYSIGYQRELDKNTVVEVRYVGNRGRDLWRQYNLNELNTVENGFAADFVRAQANLLANNAAGGSRAGSFAYFGANTGTQPLPSIVAYFNGVSAANAGNSALYTSGLFRNGTLIAQLSPNNPNVLGFAANTEGNTARRQNALNAGLPANFFRLNPTTLGGAFIVSNDTETSYDAGVIEVRRRFAQGLRFQASYTYSKALSNAYASSSVVFSGFSTLRDRSLNKTQSPFDLRHAFKFDAIYDLPFGRGRAYFSNLNPIADAFLGGWSLIPVLRYQSGSPFNLGNVQLVGITREELQKEVKVRKGDTVVTYLPDDIIRNTQAAFNVDPTNPTGYSAQFGVPTGRFIAPAGFGNCIQRFTGECGFSNVVLYGPNFLRFDVSLSKRIRIDEKRNVELRAAFLNAPNNASFRVGGWAADVINITNFGAATFGELGNGTAYLDTSTTNDPGGRLIDIIVRINF